MIKNKRRQFFKIIMFMVIIFLLCLAFFTIKKNSVQKTFWALVPSFIAIDLALITKEVYSSLFAGIFFGGLLYSNFNFENTMNYVFQNVLIEQLGNKYNIGILIFLVILGILVTAMNKAGGSKAFGDWAGKHIKSKIGAQCATIFLGMIIFIDDYFNCLTVGSVMRPITDKYKISRAKLAYLIDSTAAPICIIAPISSWAAAVSGFIENQNGIELFIKTIPFNFYALLTIVMMFLLALFKIDFGPMKKCEENIESSTNEKIFEFANRSNLKNNKKEKVIDLVLPIIFLICFCVLGMIYSGGFFSGENINFVQALSQSDASVGLVYGSFLALVLSFCLYIFRGVLNFKECMECISQGFISMVAPILILSFAWSLKAVTDNLGAREFVAELVKIYAGGFINFMPCILFLISGILAFATGTSWGTFGILIPIVINIFEKNNYQMMIISMSACMSGAVCGDHCSPISDTTIMSSAGAQSDHMEHVLTQLPYALSCAFISSISYLIAGFTKSGFISLMTGIILLVVFLVAIKKIEDKKIR